jgi:multiple sugar transport system substrate-binding protein
MSTRRRSRRGPVAVLIAAVFALTGCSAGGWGFGGSSNGGKVELTYALWDPYEQVGYQKSIDLFEKAHPDIHVTVEQIPYGNYQQKITAQYISDDAPDVFWVNTPWLGDWVKGKLLSDITSRVQQAHIDLSQYYPALVKLHEYQGHLYGLPKDWDTIALYYNRNYFEKLGIKRPPQNLVWNPTNGGSFLTFLKRVTTDTRGRNALDPKFNPNSVATYAVAMTNDLQAIYGNYFAMNGGSVLPYPFATKSSINSPQNEQTLTFLIDMLQKAHVVVPNGQTGPNGGSDNTETLFASVRSAMWQTGDWNTNSLSQLSNFKVGVMPIPAGPKGRVSMLNGLTDGIVSNTPHPEQAWELVQWLASAKSQAILGSGGYIWPAIKRLDPLFLDYWKKKGIDVAPFLEEVAGQTANFPVASGISEGITNITTALGPTFLGTENAATGLASAQKILDYRISYFH